MLHQMQFSNHISMPSLYSYNFHLFFPSFLGLPLYWPISLCLRNSPFEDSKNFSLHNVHPPSYLSGIWLLFQLTSSPSVCCIWSSLSDYISWQLESGLAILYCICFITMLTKIWQKSFFDYVNTTWCLINFQDINWVYTILKSLLTQELFPNTWKVSFRLEKKLWLTERKQS